MRMLRSLLSSVKIFSNDSEISDNPKWIESIERMEEEMANELPDIDEQAEPQAEATTPYTDRVSTFDKACASSRKVFLERNKQYGDAISSTGVLGASVELIGNVARLRQMVLKSRDHGRSQKKELAELAKDIHNYADILLMMIAEDNWEGN